MQQSILCPPSLIFFLPNMSSPLAGQVPHDEDLVSDLVGYVGSSSSGPSAGSEMAPYWATVLLLWMAVHVPGIFVCALCAFLSWNCPPLCPLPLGCVSSLPTWRSSWFCRHSGSCQFMLADCVQGMGRSVTFSMIKMCDWALGSAYESQQIFFFIVLRWWEWLGSQSFLPTPPVVFGSKWNCTRAQQPQMQLYHHSCAEVAAGSPVPSLLSRVHTGRLTSQATLGG